LVKNQYTSNVESGSTKTEIKHWVELFFGVKVIDLTFLVEGVKCPIGHEGFETICSKWYSPLRRRSWKILVSLGSSRIGTSLCWILVFYYGFPSLFKTFKRWESPLRVELPCWLSSLFLKDREVFY
jgi:hypothetical protein